MYRQNLNTSYSFLGVSGLTFLLLFYAIQVKALISPFLFTLTFSTGYQASELASGGLFV